MIPLNGHPLAVIKRRAAPLLVTAITGICLIACLSGTVPESAAFATQEAYSLAQATLDHGRSELDEMSHRETAVSLGMAEAAARQKSILEQTQAASNAEAVAMDQAATRESESAAATVFSYNVSGSQTAQAQATLNALAAQTAQVQATQTAYSLTATPWAALQVDLAREKTEADRAARWQFYVVYPVKTGAWLVAGLLLLLAAVWIFRRLINFLDPDFWPIRVQALQPLIKPLLRRSQPRLPRDETFQVEVVGPFEPSVVNWIAEAERQLRIRP